MTAEAKRIEILLKKLHQIPHLKLDISFSEPLLRQELQNIQNWYPHFPAGWEKWPQDALDRYSSKYRGISLFEFNAQANYVKDNYEIFNSNAREEGLQKHPEHGYALFRETELAAKMPYATSCIHAMTERPGRVRVMRSEPDHSIPWHSHNNGPWYNDHMLEAIVHIPIVTNERVLHVVQKTGTKQALRDKGHTSGYEQLVNGHDYFLKNYKPGECWLFNGWHDHYFHNYGNEVRYTILCYFRWALNEKLLDLLERSLDKYDGPLVEQIML